MKRLFSVIAFAVIFNIPLSAYSDDSAGDFLFVRNCGKFGQCIQGNIKKGLPLKLYSILNGDINCEAKSGESFHYSHTVPSPDGNTPDDTDAFMAVKIVDTKKCKHWSQKKYTNAVVGTSKKVSVAKKTVLSDVKAIANFDKIVRSSEVWLPDKPVYYSKIYESGIAKPDPGPTLAALSPKIKTVIRFQINSKFIYFVNYEADKSLLGVEYFFPIIVVDGKAFRIPAKGLITGPPNMVGIDSKIYFEIGDSCNHCDAWQAVQMMEVTSKEIRITDTVMMFGGIDE